MVGCLEQRAGITRGSWPWSAAHKPSQYNTAGVSGGRMRKAIVVWRSAEYMLEQKWGQGGSFERLSWANLSQAVWAAQLTPHPCLSAWACRGLQFSTILEFFEHYENIFSWYAFVFVGNVHIFIDLGQNASGCWLAEALSGPQCPAVKCLCTYTVWCRRSGLHWEIVVDC